MTAIAGISAAMLVSPLVIAGSAGAKTLTPLQAGLKFYSGQTLTFIVSSTAGSPYDVEARTLAPEIGQYLHATVNVFDNSAGANVAGQNQLAASPANGLFFGYLNTGAVIYDQVTSTPGVEFNASAMAFLASVAAPDHTLIVQTNTPYQTFGDLITKTTAAAPVSLITLVGSGTTLAQYLLMTAFGIHARYITGYANSAALVTGFLRGDGAGAYTAVSSIGSYLAAGTARDLVDMYRLAPGVLYANASAKVPSLAQLAAKYPPKTKIQQEALQTLELYEPESGEPFVAPSAIPTTQLTALRAAFAWALKQATVKQQFDAQGHELDAQSGPAAKSLFLKAVAAVKKYAGPLNLAAGAGGTG